MFQRRFDRRKSTLKKSRQKVGGVTKTNDVSYVVTERRSENVGCCCWKGGGERRGRLYEGSKSETKFGVSFWSQKYVVFTKFSNQLK